MTPNILPTSPNSRNARVVPILSTGISSMEVNDRMEKGEETPQNVSTTEQQQKQDGNGTTWMMRKNRLGLVVFSLLLLVAVVVVGVSLAVTYSNRHLKSNDDDASTTTYSNVAGTNERINAPCCSSDEDCREGFYCYFSEGECGPSSSQHGTCAEIPLDCDGEDESPVCGCDGTTYTNPCDAALAGVSIQNVGECSVEKASTSMEIQLCQDNEDCVDEGSFCRHEDGKCDVQGVCTEAPTFCMAIYDPVCGCNGETYGNSCTAAAAGVSVLADGECEPIGCDSDNDCPGDDTYCMFAPGECGGRGVCADVTPGCEKTYEPVCGCDGITYGNACCAAGNGTSIVAEGECCNTNDDCEDIPLLPKGSAECFCKFPHGICEGLGGCTMKPLQECTDGDSPVCGCDGNTYSNACSADAAGVSVLSEGECCNSNDDCEAEDFCKLEHGICEGPGVCKVKPQICTLDWSPVCGCDGKTYGNVCGADGAGVPILYEGECCNSDDDCEAEYFCKRAQGICEEDIGGCSWKKQVCTDDYSPVCGCDGITYSNACNADAAGVSIEFEGECGCNSNADCGDDFFCKFPLGDCGTSGTAGECTRTGLIPCTLEWDPMCGCDGMTTFGNPCAAEAAAMSILFRGECPIDSGNSETDSGTTRTDPAMLSCDTCGASECVLAFVEGDCGTSKQGECIARPTECSRMEDPVCGCDGVTYGNDCIALKDGGVSVNYKGEC